MTPCDPADINYNLCVVMVERVQALSDHLDVMDIRIDWVVQGVWFAAGLIAAVYAFSWLKGLWKGRGGA